MKEAFKRIIIIAVILGFALVLFLVLQDLYYTGIINLDGYAVLTILLFTGLSWYLYTRLKKVKSLKREDLRKKLTQREIEVFTLMIQEKTNPQIADELFIEESTLKSHINRIYKKLKVKNRRQLIARSQGSS